MTVVWKSESGLATTDVGRMAQGRKEYQRREWGCQGDCGRCRAGKNNEGDLQEETFTALQPESGGGGKTTAAESDMAPSSRKTRRMPSISSYTAPRVWWTCSGSV